ncbi:hypothetical protein IWW57_003254 [Coemansia sp. S610]|nr:hypothetical protein IWW57_003254 [Coemansia sp. S610]
MDAKATKNLTLTAGVKFGLLFRENAKEQSRFIQPHHKGPVMIYLAPLASNGEGDVWFKIFEKGYDTKTKRFFTEELQETRGAMDFTIPEDIAAGEYLMRTDVLALHQAKKKGMAEFYPNCVQIKLVSKGTAKPKGYPIPGVFKADHPGLLIDIYDPIKSYEMPGPPLYSKELGTTPQNQEGEIPEEGNQPEEGDKPEDGEPVVKKPKVPAGKKKPCNGRKKKKRHFK